MLEGESIEIEGTAVEQEKKRPYYFQLDVLKSIAIAFVVLDHSLTWEIKGAMGSVFWERLSIPFFLIVMGFNMGVSFQYRGAHRFRDLYTIDYFKRKLKRYVLPFIILYIASILLGVALGFINTNMFLLLGYLPFWGPGNWFIPLLFGSIVVFPIVYWLFDRIPKVTIALCFLSELVLQYLLWNLYPIAVTEFDWFIITAIRVNVLFYLPAVGLGLWFSRGFDIRAKRNWFMYLYAPICVMFMVDYATLSPVTHRGILSSMPNVFGEFIGFVQDFIVGDYTLIFYGYAALLFLIAMAIIPQTATGIGERFIQRVGRSTYHILLSQIFWLSIVYWNVAHSAVFEHQIPNFLVELGWPGPLYYIPFYLINLGVAFTGGMIWYELERRVLYNQK
ncbi:MAG: acyltransferase family protein [Promethearchaeota archaeon]